MSAGKEVREGERKKQTGSGQRAAICDFIKKLRKKE